MGKVEWKPGNMVYPVPAVLVSCADTDGSINVFTAAWTGTVCTNPPMVYVSIRPQRHSYEMIKRTGEYVINLTTESLVRAVDFCGVKSGRDVDKFKEARLTPVQALKVKAPLIDECPVNIECRVTQINELGSHHMFLAEVVAVHVDERYFDENDRFDLGAAKPIAYSHGEYYGLGRLIGTFGYSVRKKKKKKK